MKLPIVFAACLAALLTFGPRADAWAADGAGSNSQHIRRNAPTSRSTGLMRGRGVAGRTGHGGRGRGSARRGGEEAQRAPGEALNPVWGALANWARRGGLAQMERITAAQQEVDRLGRVEQDALAQARPLRAQVRRNEDNMAGRSRQHQRLLRVPTGRFRAQALALERRAERAQRRAARLTQEISERRRGVDVTALRVMAIEAGLAHSVERKIGDFLHQLHDL